IGLPAKACDFIHLAGHLHDVGKLTLPKKILIKPGPLDKQEWELIKSHPKIGFDLLSPVKLFQGQGRVLEMILYHHERWDGKGYPFGLKGKEIPLGARIISIADAFSAMVCERPYRKPLSFDEALEEIKKGAGTQFDPMLVNIFVNIYEEITNWAKGFIS
ncbi:MAG: HD-GYP domain-containing protein, partial [Thermodesulfobacteriaceae bacterium]|nr:HD-GYP domain-containing protein [Thermodesulfobacteriaceae bacterium]